MFIVIAVSFSIQELIGNTIPLREVVIMFYICNEALSLLENAAVFVPIPDKLKDVLIQLRDKDTEEDIEGEYSSSYILYVVRRRTGRRAIMEDNKNMEVVADQNEGLEYDEGIEPTPEEIEAAKALAEQEA